MQQKLFYNITVFSALLSRISFKKKKRIVIIPYTFLLLSYLVLLCGDCIPDLKNLNIWLSTL